MRAIGAILATLLAWPAAGPAAAQTSYPERPVRIIVGFTPGSATDITARIFAQKFSEAWGVAVTVENVPGAGGTVGLDRVAKAAPDGYTLAGGERRAHHRAQPAKQDLLRPGARPGADLAGPDHAEHPGGQ